MNDVLTEEEFETLIKLAKKVLWADSEIRKRVQQHKINIVPANFYSDIPLVEEIEASFENSGAAKEVYNSGIFNKEGIRDFIEAITAYAEEFSPPLNGDKDFPEEFFWKNPAFSHSDAMSYYCVLKHYQPLHILEIGSGFSTLVAHAAIEKNGKGKLTLIEPYPKEFLRNLTSVDAIIESRVQDIAVPELVQLVESADIWFIDSTHTVKMGSDCLYIYLKVMPQISTNIIVHTHDIYLPFGSSKELALKKHIYWTEQYLLYAYMLDNPKIRVLYGSAYAKAFLLPELDQLMGEKFTSGGASIWYELNGAPVAQSLA